MSNISGYSAGEMYVLVEIYSGVPIAIGGAWSGSGRQAMWS